jgi:hypothetical protein
MTDIREAAAKAAREWHDRHLETRMPRDNMDAAEFWLLGHAAGVADGARAFDKLVAAAEFYLEERACFGIGSRMGCCAGTHNEPARRCVHLSKDPNEWCFSGKFREALDFLASRPAPGTGLAQGMEEEE